MDVGQPEFEREIAPESLSESEIRRLTELTFVPHDPGPADLLFVFGTVQGDWQGLAAALNHGWFPHAILAGKSGGETLHGMPTLAQHMRAQLLAAGAPPERLTLQEQATNTLEDISLSLDLIAERFPVGPRSICFFAKAHHSGRCARTLRRFFPKVPLRAWTMPARYGDVAVDEGGWMETEIGRARVYGEALRIERYAARGDIASEA